MKQTLLQSCFQKNGFHRGSGWVAFVVRGGACAEGGDTSSTIVEQHTLIKSHTNARKPGRGWGWGCAGRVLSLSPSVGVRAARAEA